MKTYGALADHRDRSFTLSLVDDPVAFGSVRRPDPATREADTPVSPQVSLALIVASSLGLWALIWFALTCLISNWP
jgi:hypothetical protein